MKRWYDVMIIALHRSDQSKNNQALKLDYVLKIAAAYFNEIAMLCFAVGLDYLSIYLCQ